MPLSPYSMIFIGGHSIDLLMPPSDSIPITDAMTLSLALWCQALRHSPEVINITEASLNIVQTRADFGTLLEFGQEAVLLAAELRKENTESTAVTGTPRSRDFILNALAQELCTVAISSAVTAYHYLSKRGLAADDFEPGEPVSTTSSLQQSTSWVDRYRRSNA